MDVLTLTEGDILYIENRYIRDLLKLKNSNQFQFCFLKKLYRIGCFGRSDGTNLSGSQGFKV